KRWAHMVCDRDCRTTEDLRWGFVESLGSICQDSPQFDRYIVSHYFRNRGLEYGKASSLEDRQGFCLFGYVTALVVLAQFEFPRSVAHAQRYLFRALTLLGDFFVFDWLDSSSWPVRLWDINFHLIVLSNEWKRSVSPDVISIHPGE
ncbi:unnamed protein product, partial [Polarella glacialis]